MSFRDWLSGEPANAKVANPAKDDVPNREAFATFATFAVATPAEPESEAEREAFEERAAIYEFEAGFDRRESERRARIQVAGSVMPLATDFPRQQMTNR